MKERILYSIKCVHCQTLSIYKGNLDDVVANVLDSNIIKSEFELLSLYYVHFWTNTLGKGMNSLITPNNGLNSTTIVLLQG